MIDALGEDHLLLPGLIGAALAANDRVKYLLTLLQAARLRRWDGALRSLREERLATGIDDVALDRVCPTAPGSPTAPTGSRAPKRWRAARSQSSRRCWRRWSRGVPGARAWPSALRLSRRR